MVTVARQKREQAIDKEIDEFLKWIETMRKDHEYGRATGKQRSGKRAKDVRSSHDRT